MIGFPKTPPLRRVVLTLGLLVTATSAADAAPLRYNITDLGVIDELGIDNDGQLIDRPVRNLIGDPGPKLRSPGGQVPYGLGFNFQAVDGTGDGRFLFGSEHYPLHERDVIKRDLWIYTPGDGHGGDPQWVQLGEGEVSTRLMGGYINARGEVIGKFVAHGPRDNVPYVGRPFYVSVDDPDAVYELADLVPESGWTFLTATSINDHGQILGRGINPDGERHSYLLTPENVPEPGTWAVFGLAAAALAWRNRRRAA